MARAAWQRPQRTGRGRRGTLPGSPAGRRSGNRGCPGESHGCLDSISMRRLCAANVWRDAAANGGVPGGGCGEFSWMSRLVFSETSPSLVRRSAAYGVSGQWGYAACAVGLAATKAFERRSAADGRRCTADRSPGQAPMGWRPALAGMQGRDPSLEVCREHPRCRGRLPCIRVIRCWSAKKLSLRRDTLHGPAGEGRIASGGSGRVTSAWRRHESGWQGRPWRGPVGLT